MRKLLIGGLILVVALIGAAAYGLATWEEWE